VGYTFDEAVEIVNARRQQQGPLLQQMIAIRDRYNGDYALPLPNGVEGELKAKIIPALLADGIDQPAMKASGSSPSFFFPAVDPTKEEGAKSFDWAGKRRRAAAAVWHESQWLLLRRRMYRHIGGYARPASCWCRPQHEIPRIAQCDPPAYLSQSPEDVSFPQRWAVFARTVGWISRTSATRRSRPWAVRSAPTSPAGRRAVDCLSGSTRLLHARHHGPHYLYERGPVRGPPASAQAVRQQDGLPPGGGAQLVTLDKIISRLVFMTSKVDVLPDGTTSP
jgi:hypothetical protein